MSLFDLTGKVAIVTGSSRGIGRSIAEQMAAHGARVVISSRKADACEAVAASIRASGGEAVAIAANISRREDLESLVARTRERLGPIDVLVCNAASNPYFGPAEGMSDEVFDKVMRNNVLSVSAKGIAKTKSIITNIRTIPGFVMFFFTNGSSMYCLYFSDSTNCLCKRSELWTQKKPVSR